MYSPAGWLWLTFGCQSVDEQINLMATYWLMVYSLLVVLDLSLSWVGGKAEACAPGGQCLTTSA